MNSITAHSMQTFGYILLRGLFRLFGRLPLGFHYAVGRGISWLADNVIRYRRDVVVTNIARSFPDKKYNELKVIRKQFYRHFGEIFAETVWFCGCSDPKRLRGSHIVEYTNPEELNRVYDASPSVMLLTSHAGNWELTGGFVSYSYKEPVHVAENDVCVVYRKLHSKTWDELMRKNRITPIVDKAHYEGPVESEEIMRYVVRHRNDRKLYYFITDQFPYRGSSRIDVGDFLHQPTLSMDGGAKLAHKFGMGVVYMNMVPVARGRYEITFTTICDDASSMDPEDIMRNYYKLLQSDVEAAPHNWLWSHKRWK